MANIRKFYKIIHIMHKKVGWPPHYYIGVAYGVANSDGMAYAELPKKLYFYLVFEDKNHTFALIITILIGASSRE